MNTMLKKVDWWLITITGALVFIGVMMVFSTTSIVGLSQYNDPYYFVKKQLIFVITGLVLFGIGCRVPHTKYAQYLIPGLGVSTIVLLLTLFPGIGVTIGGAKRWLNTGFVQFQPIEGVKFFLSVFLSVALSNKSKIMTSFTRGILPILLVMVVPILILVAQPDLGNILLILAVMLMMLYIGRVPISLLSGLGVVALMGVIVSILTHPYQLARILSFLNPWDDPLGKNYHIIQSFTAIGSGGLFGVGIGQSQLKYFYLPLHYSDFVFSVICEEGGFLLAVAVIMLFVGLLYRCMCIARQTSSLYSGYLVMSLCLFLVMQACLNIGVVIGLFPITGIPLSFISYGGSSFVMSLFFVGVIHNVYCSSG